MKKLLLISYLATFLCFYTGCGSETPDNPNFNTSRNINIGSGNLLFEGDIDDFDYSGNFPENLVIGLKNGEAYRSSNFGKNWEKIYDKYVSSVAIDNYDPNTIYIVSPG